MTMSFTALLLLIFASFFHEGAESKVPSHQEKHEKVLVIGAAGFIGFHLMEQLHMHRSTIHTLTGLDSFNVDHSVRLKRQRAEYLESKHGLHIRSSNQDMCNVNKISARLSEEKYSHIFLMASPATSTLQDEKSINLIRRKQHVKRSAHCFDKLLKAVIAASELHKSSPKFIYALPSPLHLPSDALSQTRIWEMEMRTALYSVAHDYFKHHGLLSVGMYFDVVYGPWDNPDSTISSWAASAYRQQPVKVTKELLLQARQYSFVEDLAKGISTIMDYAPNKPVVLDMTVGDQFVAVLSDTLSIFRSLEFSTKKNISLMMSTSQDVDNLYLGTITDGGFDTSVLPAVSEIYYYPMFPLQKGIERFVEWFRHYESRIFPCASECVGDGVAIGGRSSSFNEELCFASVWDRVARLSQQITVGCENVYYTVAIDSTVDGLHPLAKFEEEPQLHCNIAFVSRNSPFVQSNDTNRFTPEQVMNLEHFSYENWTIVVVDDFTAFTDPRKPTRVPKLSPSKFFAESVRYAVYMDSKLLITCDPRDYIAMMPAEYSGNQRKGPLSLLAVRISEHPAGIFYHIDHVLKRTAERPSITFYDQILKQQKRAYREYEDRLGVKFVNIFDGAFMIHELQSSAGKDFRCAWYREYQQWSDRDQVAVSYIITRRAKAMQSKAAYERKEFIPIGKELMPASISTGSSQLMSYTAERMLVTSTSTVMEALASDMRNLSYNTMTLSSGFIDTSRLLANLTSQHYEEHQNHTTRQLRHKDKQRRLHYVRLLPRLEYHWTYHSERIGRLEFFQWNRLDDEKYKNMASILLEMERRRMMKQCLRYGIIILVVLVSGAVGYRRWRSYVRCQQQRSKREADP